MFEKDFERITCSLSLLQTSASLPTHFLIPAVPCFVPCSLSAWTTLPSSLPEECGQAGCSDACMTYRWRASHGCCCLRLQSRSAHSHDQDPGSYLDLEQTFSPCFRTSVLRPPLSMWRSSKLHLIIERFLNNRLNALFFKMPTIPIVFFLKIYFFDLSVKNGISHSIIVYLYSKWPLRATSVGRLEDGLNTHSHPENFCSISFFTGKKNKNEVLTNTSI